MHATMIGHKVEHAVTVRALRGAAPYIHMYKGKVFVIKTGGGAFREPATMRAFVEQVAILHHLGIRIVLVHGGGPQLDEVTARLGVETRMVQGRRVTDDAAIDATSMVLNGLINTRLLGLCREFGISAIGLSGVDGGLVRAPRRPPVTLANGEVVDYGMVGDIDTIDASVIMRLLDAGFLPVVSPLSSDATGQLLNINADTVAAAIGGALAAEKLILCTGAAGILERIEDPRSLISYIDLPGLRRLREEGALADGMLPKASAIEAAIRGGVRRVHVISYSAPEALLAEIFTNEGTGTLVVADTKALSAAEQGTGGA
jgi:acetylglutamate kinase